ncbi:hypothetical protein PTT_05231 [Pyrenophora teres f. teres 0-1]|uniref:Uncharacterized protein n=2 Tax=Pyrenophora teres f. teres TaxID=97479 RepID=E3REW5_PYRTT|nr:hypothetical protein PTT_05231 [Pyrenophora teres f. teres 0-1]KAE8831173.1 hypothetical protein HRS9122_08763 [Pyrenophora teres f. teres]CAE7209452.1 hypothetical protein PTTW11_09912 [Pyrenophora teres f. teres]
MTKRTTTTKTTKKPIAKPTKTPTKKNMPKKSPQNPKLTNPTTTTTRDTYNLRDRSNRTVGFYNETRLAKAALLPPPPPAAPVKKVKVRAPSSPMPAVKVGGSP